MKTVTEHLLALADAGNAAFTARLAPGVDPDRMLGCRIPQLRRLARTLRGTPEAAAFLTQLPHRYYDENNLHGILLGHIRPTGEALDALERFLPHIDNWATCDITACGMKTLGRAPASTNGSRAGAPIPSGSGSSPCWHITSTKNSTRTTSTG